MASTIKSSLWRITRLSEGHASSSCTGGSESEGRPHVLSGVFDILLQPSNFHLQNMKTQKYKKYLTKTSDNVLFVNSRLSGGAPPSAL